MAEFDLTFSEKANGLIRALMVFLRRGDNSKGMLEEVGDIRRNGPKLRYIFKEAA